jgi:uncharacterized protein YukE
MSNSYQILANEWGFIEREVTESDAVWSDATRREFDNQYWRELVQETEDYLSALSELGDTLESIRQDMP